jgi:alpha-galactosidase
MEQAKASIAEMKENQKYWYGDYYPLSPWSMAPDAWMAYQFHRPDLDEGMVLAFRHKDCPQSEFSVKLRGLNPQRMYIVKFSDEQRKETMKTMLGSELAATVLRIEKPRSSLLLRYGPAPASQATE